MKSPLLFPVSSFLAGLIMASMLSSACVPSDGMDIGSGTPGSATGGSNGSATASGGATGSGSGSGGATFVSSSGGMTGSGGALASGGAPGSGGAPVASSGGAPGTGGAPAAATGGVQGGGAGRTGTAGSAGGGGGTSGGPAFTAIAALLGTSCGSCHDGTKHVDLRNTTGLYMRLVNMPPAAANTDAGCKTMSLVVPDNAATSLLSKVVKGAVAGCTDGKMPNGCTGTKCLTTAQTGMIDAWIAAGAPM
jgi:hypothetical protein